MTARIAVYLVLGFVALVALLSWQEREDGRLEERERLTVAHAIRWHKSYVVARREVDKLSVVAKQAVARSVAMRDSVRIVSDSLLAIVTRDDTMPPRVDTVTVPRVVVRRLVADSVTIARLTALTDVQARALTVADSTIAAYQAALHAAQANKCRIVWKVPCPSRKAVVLLTAGTLLVAKITLGGTL